MTTLLTPHRILGINSAYHESSAALIEDGRIFAAVEEERFSGIKHGKSLRVDNAHSLPWRAIRYCLDTAKIDWQDLSAVAYSFSPELRQIHACLGDEGSPMTFGHPVGEDVFQKSLQQIPKLIGQRTTAPFFFVPHHEAHAWYAIGTSPFERSAVLVVDGIGEGASVSIGTATRSHLSLVPVAFFPASVGIAWEKVARFLGLTEYDACKVMALAAFGKEDAKGILEPHLHFDLGRLIVNDDIFRLEFPDDFAGLAKLFHDYEGNNASLAAKGGVALAMQHATEQLLISLGRHIREKYPDEHNLSYGGGVALNGRANMALAQVDLFAEIYAGPASHDGGTALGAAFSVYVEKFGGTVPLQSHKKILFSGPTPSLPNLHQTNKEGRSWTCLATSDSLSKTIALLKEDHIVGWVWGRCEFGPRALGARSLLAAPFDKDIVARINRFKGRYTYEPIAISIAEEFAREVFELPESVKALAASMLIIAVPHSAWKDRFSHLLHADGTLRIQIVSKGDHAHFHALLTAFADRSSIPLLLNTSFNPRGKPMAGNTDDIILITDEIGLNHLVVNGRILQRDLVKATAKVNRQEGSRPSAYKECGSSSFLSY